MQPEPRVELNGRILSDAEVMTLRVAIESFAISLIMNGLGEDEIGKEVAQNYLHHLKRLREYMTNGKLPLDSTPVL